VTLVLEEPATHLPASLGALGLELAAPGRLVFRYRPSRTRLAAVFTAVQAAGFTIRDVSSEESDLEEVFLRLTGASGVRR
jgi:ABC-2 type transport system ATP-binding protein